VTESMPEPRPEPVREPRPEPVREPTSDDTGWGDESAAEKAERDAEWYRQETPPHHGD
jgi:hypothetical protein